MSDGRLYGPIEINCKEELVYLPRNQWERVEIYSEKKLTRKQSRAFMALNSGLTLGHDQTRTSNLHDPNNKV
jgi:hypothetical protein